MHESEVSAVSRIFPVNEWTKRIFNYLGEHSCSGAGDPNWINDSKTYFNFRFIYFFWLLFVQLRHIVYAGFQMLDGLTWQINRFEVSENAIRIDTNSENNNNANDLCSMRFEWLLLNIHCNNWQIANRNLISFRYLLAHKSLSSKFNFAHESDSNAFASIDGRREAFVANFTKWPPNFEFYKRIQPNIRSNYIFFSVMSCVTHLTHKKISRIRRISIFLSPKVLHS